jgi:hypothetical protein
VKRIRDCDREGISKNGARFHECHAVLPLIRGILSPIPFESDPTHSYPNL